MVKFNNNIVQFGFGAVGKSFFENVSHEVRFDENKYFVISRDKSEFDAFINMGGISTNFIVCEIDNSNFSDIFKNYLSPGDLLLDFADTVGTLDILNWCISNEIMYLNTGEADWPENWYSILNENIKKTDIKKIAKVKYPIVLQHGNNPGLVSHFVKAGIEYIVNTQVKKFDKIMYKKASLLIKENKFNEVAYLIGLDTIHVNDIDLQKTNIEFKEDTLLNTWCIDSFFFEMLSEATINYGTNLDMNTLNDVKNIDSENMFAELSDMAVNTNFHTYYSEGEFDAFLVPHEETITIANSLEVKKSGNTIYKPTVVFLYSPCEAARSYLKHSKVGSYDMNTDDVVRGYLYPKNARILYREDISSGTEYVGVLLLGKNFKPVWVGNRIEPKFLYKNIHKSKNNSYWQTPTITPVAMSALSATVWMIKNINRSGIYFPDDIPEYNEILKVSEKYISKTIFKTLNKVDYTKIFQ